MADREVMRMTFGAFLSEPLQGKTSLARVFWLYGVVGSLLYGALELLLGAADDTVTRIYVVVGLLLSAYVTVATYQCAGNCRWKSLSGFTRVAAVISLLALPLLGYLELTGALGAYLSTVSGEQ